MDGNILHATFVQVTLAHYTRVKVFKKGKIPPLNTARPTAISGSKEESQAVPLTINVSQASIFLENKPTPISNDSN